MDKVQFPLVIFFYLSQFWSRFRRKMFTGYSYAKVSFVPQQTINSRPVSDVYGFFLTSAFWVSFSKHLWWKLCPSPVNRFNFFFNQIARITQASLASTVTQAQIQENDKIF